MGNTLKGQMIHIYITKKITGNYFNTKSKKNALYWCYMGHIICKSAFIKQRISKAANF